MSWTSLASALARHRPEVVLAGPAPSEARILALFAGAPSDRLPLDAIWGTHDGSKGAIDAGASYELLDLRSAMEAHSLRLRQLVGDGVVEGGTTTNGARDEIFLAGWIPFAGDRDWDHLLCVDLDPAPDGVVGQILEVHHIEGVHARVASSLEEWLARQSDAIDEAALVEREVLEGKSKQRSSRRAALEATLARCRAAGLDLGAIHDDDLEDHPTFQIGQGSEWDPEASATKKLLLATPGVHGRGGIGFDGRLALVRLPAIEWGPPFDVDAALAPAIARLRSEGAETNAHIVAALVEALNHALAHAGDPRRLHKVIGKGTPLYLRYLLLTSERRATIEAAGLLRFEEEEPDQGGSFGGWKRFFGRS